MSTQQPGVRRVLLDTATWFGGWALIFKQAGILFAPPSHVNETLILVGAAMIGVPGVASVLMARFGGTGTPASPSPPVEPASSASPPGASSVTGEATP